jgi:hypothetical protein
MPSCPLTQSRGWSLGQRIQEASLHGDHDGMRAVFSAQFGHDALHARLDRIFRDIQRFGDITITATLSHQRENDNLAIGQSLATRVARNFLSHFGRHDVATRQRAAYRPNNFLAPGRLQKVGGGAEREGPDHSSVPGKGRQHNNCRVGEFAANGRNGLQAVHDRHLKVDQHYVRKQLSKQFNRFFAIGGFAADFHIGFLLDDRPQAVSHDRVVIDNKDPELFVGFVQKVTCFPSPVPKTRA